MIAVVRYPPLPVLHGKGILTDFVALTPDESAPRDAGGMSTESPAVRATRAESIQEAH